MSISLKHRHRKHYFDMNFYHIVLAIVIYMCWLCLAARDFSMKYFILFAHQYSSIYWSNKTFPVDISLYLCSGSAGASVVAHSVALPLIEVAFSTLDCSIVPTCGAWCSATAAKRGPLKQSWAEIQHSRDDEPLGVLMQMRDVRVNGFFFFSSLGVLPGVLVDTLSLCSGNFCVECVLIVLHEFFI